MVEAGERKYIERKQVIRSFGSQISPNLLSAAMALTVLGIDLSHWLIAAVISVSQKLPLILASQFVNCKVSRKVPWTAESSDFKRVVREALVSETRDIFHTSQSSPTSGLADATPYYLGKLHLEYEDVARYATDDS